MVQIKQVQNILKKITMMVILCKNILRVTTHCLLPNLFNKEEEVLVQSTTKIAQFILVQFFALFEDRIWAKDFKVYVFSS